ncbi:MAG: hypothetical protein PWR17_877 [Candidatus Methanomethylophilaceae archaeon]|nr:hypothetical protein [Candidatus Methanomethylophilaceae archaeon]
MKDLAYEAMERAKRQNSSGNPQGAAKTLEEYLIKDPHNVKPRILLSNMYIYSLNMFDFGIFQLDIVSELEPDNVDCLKAKVTALSSKKKFNRETNELYQHLVEIDPSADVFDAYGTFLRMQMIDFKKSAEYYSKAIAKDPNNSDYRINYASLLLNDLRDYVAAKKELEIIITLDPENHNARKNLTKLLSNHFDSNGNLKKGFGHKPKKI